jgi:hypothetical protein
MKKKGAFVILLLLCVCILTAQVNFSSPLVNTPVQGARFSAGFSSIAATLTQVQAAPVAGMSLYITDIDIQTTTTTSGTYSFQSGTGTNCATGTAAIFPVSGTGNKFNAPITSNAMAQFSFQTPIKLASATALCVIGVATNTVSGQVMGYTAP